jgi:hypothetical protein
VRILVATAVSALVLASTASAIKLPPSPDLPAGWSHASVNIIIRRVPHTLTYDRGRVVAVNATSLTLREPDGSVVTIGIDGNTIVRIQGQRSSIDQVRRLEQATTVTVDGGAAALVTVRIPPGLRR